MGFAHLIGLLVLIGVLSWAVIYLFGDKMDPGIASMIKKLAIVLCVLAVLLFILSLCGVVDFNINRVLWGPPR